MGADGQGEEKAAAGRGSGSKAASLPEYSFMPPRAGGSKGSRTRRQAWKSRSRCCRLTGEEGKDPWGQTLPFPAPRLKHREDALHFQILLMCPPPETHLQMVHKCAHGGGHLERSWLYSEIDAVEALATLV